MCFEKRHDRRLNTSCPSGVSLTDNLGNLGNQREQELAEPLKSSFLADRDHCLTLTG
jgi:hypothetical protein